MLRSAFKNGLITLLAISTLPLVAQNIIWEETFNENALPPGWSTQSLNSSMAIWEITTDGTASNGVFWDGRPAINSDNPNNAAMFDSDGSSVVGALAPHHAILTSSDIDLAGFARVGLQFTQYYRNLQSVTRVNILDANNQQLASYSINGSVGFNTETTNSSQILIDISDIAADLIIRLQFEFEGNNYFWIIDDIRLIELSPGFGEVFPRALGDSLTNWEYPYAVDSLGGAYEPHRLVVKFQEETPEMVRDSIRDKFHVVSYDTCFCSGPELWILPDTLTADLGENLLFNGSFEEDFSLENDLISSCSCLEGSYCIAANMTAKCSNWSDNDFTAAEGNLFLIIDGSTNGPATLWQQAVPVKEDSTYIFIFQARNYQELGFPLLELQVNGNTVGSVQPEVADEWGTYYLAWKNNTNLTNITLGLRQANFSTSNFGYDYGLDDFYFGEAASNTQYLDIENLKKKLTEESEVESKDFNYYAFGQLDDQPTDTLEGLPELPSQPNDSCDVLIAVIDTGVEYDYNTSNLNLESYIWENNDMQCFDNDFIGWNFVEDNNLPYDPHGHGTHVAGIIAQTLMQDTINTNCKTKIMPIASGDEHGILTLFRATCGIYYAAVHQANIINASWGFYGVQEDNNQNVMRNAIDFAYDTNEIIFVNSAGNEDAYLIDHPHYPSNYSLNNILTVGSVDSVTYTKSDFSNFSSHHVEYYTFGEGIESAVPFDLFGTDWQQRTGTSMAAPAVTGTLASVMCRNKDLDTLINFLDCISSLIPSDSLSVIDPILINTCLIVNTQEPELPPLSLRYGPNPVKGVLWISPEFDALEGIRINLYNTTGQLLQKHFIQSAFSGSKHAIDMHRLPSGMYVIQIQYKQRMQSIRVIKR